LVGITEGLPSIKPLSEKGRSRGRVSARNRGLAIRGVKVSALEKTKGRDCGGKNRGVFAQWQKASLTAYERTRLLEGLNNFLNTTIEKGRDGKAGD